MDEQAVRQVALNWAFLMDTLDMDFDELFPLFRAWCEELPDDKMADIMAMAEQLPQIMALSPEGDEEDGDETLHTEAEIWSDLDDAPNGTWIEDFPTEEHPTKKRPKGGWSPSVN